MISLIVNSPTMPRVCHINTVYNIYLMTLLLVLWYRCNLPSFCCAKFICRCCKQLASL